ncbi:class II aaRS and biotin synthetase [Tothia fuscella]|uniref:threonine--tRNA ligase n=1 Tax=Tothia fuscella TaxID=1048955 RepID=A0A9P4P276_9PEZI|nr:class II aaRS and biotin synthetase [Tothia fuscella]
MNSSHRPLLRSLYNSRRHILFNNHTRIGSSIFFKPCSCTASLAEEETKKLLNPTTDNPPKPPADHRQLALEQGIFTTSPYSPGSPLLLPNGSDMFLKLAACLRSLYPKFGFREVITPSIYKKSLWEKSGHWKNYADDMFEVRGRGASGAKKDAEIGEDETYGLKPMNCPGHCLLFKAEKRSYRQLPIRFADFSTLHRNEISGALSGLTRVRRFHQDDGHIFCRPVQIYEEIKKTMEFIHLVYGTIFQLGPYRLLLSTRPKENYIGTLEEWDNAEAALKSALETSGREWSINEGDGAFYGPKIDIILKDSDGKEHQTATIQLDFQLPKRFELEYIAPAPDLEQKGAVTRKTDPKLLETSGPVTPVIIHRAVLGSLERFMALLIEHYNGTYPLWISPRPVVILTATDSPRVTDYAEHVAYTLHQSPWAKSESQGHVDSRTKLQKRSSLLVPYARQTPLHADIDSSKRSLGKKMVEARKKGYNYIIVVGEKDVADETVNLELANQYIKRPAEESALMHKDMSKSGIGKSTDDERENALLDGGSAFTVEEGSSVEEVSEEEREKNRDRVWYIQQLPSEMRKAEKESGKCAATLKLGVVQRLFGRQVSAYL